MTGSQLFSSFQQPVPTAVQTGQIQTDGARSQTRLSALAVDLISNILRTTARNCVECVAVQRVAELTGANQMNSNARPGLPKKAKHLAGDPKHIQEAACPGSLNVTDIRTALTRVTRLPVKSQLDTRLAN